MSLLLFALAQVSLAEMAKQSPELTGYLLCVSQKARTLEPSGESAEAVAIAATSACESMVGFTAETMLQKAEAEAVNEGVSPISKGQHDQARAGAREMLRKSGHDLAVTIIVNKRAQH